MAFHDLAYERAPLPVPGVYSRVVPRVESSAQPRAKLSHAAVRWALTGMGRTHALTSQRIDLLHLHDDLLRRVLRELIMVIHSVRPQAPGTTQNYPLKTNGPRNSDPSTTTSALSREPHFPLSTQPLHEMRNSA